MHRTAAYWSKRAYTIMPSVARADVESIGPLVYAWVVITSAIYNGFKSVIESKVLQCVRQHGERGEVYVYVYLMRRDKLNGRVVAVTVISPPSWTSSDTFFSIAGEDLMFADGALLWFPASRSISYDV